MERVISSQKTCNNTRYKGLDNPIIYDHYLLTLYEIENGTHVSDITNMLKEYEEKELYYECAGIWRALDHYQFIILYALIIYYDIDHVTNIKIENYEIKDY
ncbi:MAG: hypothetical protein Unbinned5607contig1000_7 [Prokaryotic dsDNA virus sp.]|nr:MAG: hypothetical protein Unbinned5607contig1000_7 [Prokaryotic dsDNA virus sp.]